VTGARAIIARRRNSLRLLATSFAEALCSVIACASAPSPDRRAGGSF
jgi:hypothetical protein